MGRHFPRGPEAADGSLGASTPSRPAAGAHSRGDQLLVSIRRDSGIRWREEYATSTSPERKPQVVPNWPRHVRVVPSLRGCGSVGV